MNPPPIEACEQRFELGVGKRHQSILDTGPVNVCSSSRL